MRYNTGNPVGPSGSSDPRDLNDNCGVIDTFANGEQPSYPDRLGVPRQSLAGMRTNFDQDQQNRVSQFNLFLASQGFVDIGSYDSGPLTITATNQMFEKDGSYWSPSPALSLPYTTINNWASDKDLFVNRGDGAVRTQLVDVTANLDAVSEKLLIDMHYGICRGVGYNGSGGERVTTTTGLVVNGQNIPVADVTGFVPGQLIAYHAGDGEYYTAVVSSISGSSLVLQTPIEVSINAGAEVGIFYTQESHATVLGYRAIADGALRRATKKYQIIRVWRPTDDYSVVLGATAVPYADVTYANPGSSTTPSLHVTAPVANAGIFTGSMRLPAGDYIARVFLTPGLAGSSPVAVRVSETPIGSIAQAVLAQGPSPVLQELYFRKSKSGTISVVITGQDVGHQFAVSRIEIVRVVDNIRDLDRGVHVLLGDSWFSLPGIFERLQARLPNATIINKGVAGNTAAGLMARFFADVAPYNPTFVWLMVGTNDVANNVAVSTFFAQVGILSQYILSIKATGIFFNASVGAPNHPVYNDLLTRSREYVINEDYVSQAPDAVQATEVYRAPINVDVPASSTRQIIVPGSTKSSVYVRKMYAIGQAGETTGNIRIKYGTSIGATGEDAVTNSFSVSVITAVSVPKSNANERFLIIELQNTSASAISVGGFIDLEWSPVR